MNLLDIVDTNGIKIQNGDTVKTEQYSGGVFSPSYPVTGTVETRAHCNEEALVVRYRKKGFGFDSFILLFGQINTILNKKTMKKIIHSIETTEVCLYDVSDTFIEGSFFKEKPQVGDVVLSWAYRSGNGLTPFLVKSILSQRDAIIQDECTHDPKDARMQLEVENILESIHKYDIDVSIRGNL